MKRIVYSLPVLLVVGLLTACADSSKNGGDSSAGGMVGIWSPKGFHTLTRDNQPSKTKIHTGVASAAYGFMFIEISRDGAVTYSTQGTHPPDGAPIMTLVAMKMGQLDNVNSSETTMKMDPEFLKKIGKSEKGALTDEEIKAFEKNPCAYKLVSEKQLNMTCLKQDENSESEFERVTPAQKENIQSETAKAMDYSTAEMAKLQKVIGGKSFELVKAHFKFLTDGKHQEITEGPEEISKKPNETGSGEKLHILGKKIRFLEENINQAVINDNQKMIVEIRAGQGLKFLHVSINHRVTENTFHSVISGKFSLIDEGFEVQSDIEEENGDRYQETKTYKLIK